MYDLKSFVIKDTFFSKIYDKYETKLDEIMKLFYVKIATKKDKKALYITGVIREIYRYWGDMKIDSEFYERERKNKQDKYYYQYKLVPNKQNESLVRRVFPMT